jgi:hypothetical protein
VGVIDLSMVAVGSHCAVACQWVCLDIAGLKNVKVFNAPKARCSQKPSELLFYGIFRAIAQSLLWGERQV